MTWLLLAKKHPYEGAKPLESALERGWKNMREYLKIIAQRLIFSAFFMVICFQVSWCQADSTQSGWLKIESIHITGNKKPGQRPYSGSWNSAWATPCANTTSTLPWSETGSVC